MPAVKGQKYKVKPSFRQILAVDKIVENRGIMGKAMVDAGYSENTAKNPKNLTESDGYKQLLEEKGLTPGLIVESLVSDIKAKPKQRLGELSLGADILQMKQKEKSPLIALQVNVGEDRDKYR